MLAKKIKYTDFNDVEREETFYFNLSQSELFKLEHAESGGLTKRLSVILERQDVPSIMQTFEDMIRWSYGVPSADGRGFNKSDALYEEFKHTNAYDELFMELGSSSDAAFAFIRGVLPKKLAAELTQSKMDEIMNDPAGVVSIVSAGSNA